jgi:hypothetical protein
VAAYRTEYPGLWTPTTHLTAPGGRRTGRSDTTGAVAASPAHAEKRAWAAVAWDRLRLAHEHLQAADAALGNIPLVDARHEPDDGPTGRWYEQRINHTTPPGQLPAGRDDLHEAHAAMLRRHSRGE